MDTLPVDFPLAAGKVEPERPTVTHVLVVTETPAGRTYLIQCAATDRRCDTMTTCTHWQCLGERQLSEPDYDNAMTAVDGWAHDSQHHLDDETDTWCTSTGECWFAGKVAAKRIETGHPIAELTAGRYPVECIAPEYGEPRKRSSFIIVDHPASTFTSPNHAGEFDIR
jgi:hypothetical protein